MDLNYQSVTVEALTNFTCNSAACDTVIESFLMPIRERYGYRFHPVIAIKNRISSDFRNKLFRIDIQIYPEIHTLLSCGLYRTRTYGLYHVKVAL